MISAAAPAPAPAPPTGKGTKRAPPASSAPLVVANPAPGAETFSPLKQDAASFREWLLDEVRACVSYPAYTAEMEEGADIICKWRKRWVEDGTTQELKSTWMRIIKRGRCIKELNEIVPVIARVRQQVALLDTAAQGKAEILDLCCGFGYLAMFLSEMLPPEKVECLVLVDRMWPRYDVSPPWPQTHLNPTHLGHPDWPIRLVRSSQDLKAKACRANMEKHLIEGPGTPILILAVHLCGTLSLRAVEFFNANPAVVSLMLKPCCLPLPIHAIRGEEWTLGGHLIHATKVCGKGKWNNGKWYGPPRARLEPKFHRWCDALMNGTDVGETGRKTKEVISVQEDHFQNTFIFADRSFGAGGLQPPLSSVITKPCRADRKKDRQSARENGTGDGQGQGQGSAATAAATADDIGDVTPGSRPAALVHIDDMIASLETQLGGTASEKK